METGIEPFFFLTGGNGWWRKSGTCPFNVYHGNIITIILCTWCSSTGKWATGVLRKWPRKRHRLAADRLALRGCPTARTRVTVRRPKKKPWHRAVLRTIRWLTITSVADHQPSRRPSLLPDGPTSPNPVSEPRHHRITAIPNVSFTQVSSVYNRRNTNVLIL